MKKIFALLVVAVLFVACGDESSSSAPATDPGEESSSSVEKTTESSSSAKPASSEDKQSSSSAKEENSSSSVVKSSSSKKDESSSSEEVKQSSSSVVASSSSVVGESSSSEYKPYNHQKVFSSDSLLSGAYKEFTDERNGRKYYYLTINGEDKDGNPASVTVMAENLNIGIDVAGGEDQVDDSKIERYCYNDDTTNCDKYGGLYQWAEAMQLPSECNAKSCADQIKPNHRGICPEGWRLLTYDDFYIVVHADGNDAGVKGVRAMGFGGHNYSGYSLIGAGYNWGYKFRNLNETTYWFYPEEGSLDKPAALSGSQSNSSTGNALQSIYKTHGTSVRCVMVE
ncbi:FISUMP domain-containing protein [Fibrobacter sp. UWB10]|uniref:FISUMP domain-containing protein n=1 Tax=Fibrobacter sp. UWB10 TaxID=1896201 RepID=UPI00240375A2|nr:FISUMP domain-containing protein [Fibrobacter sp. UWB10]SMP53976.1 major paralogous domain-containing protein [Fibrobacter sp. UWB10]